MSRKAPQFQEKMICGQQNILIWAVESGEKAPQECNTHNLSVIYHKLKFFSDNPISQTETVPSGAKKRG